MRHRKEDGTEEYAIHDVYFTDAGQVKAYSEDALSPREPSVAKLKETLLALPQHEEVQLGDLGYAYCPEDIHYWLKNIDREPIDYE